MPRSSNITPRNGILSDTHIHPSSPYITENPLEQLDANALPNLKHFNETTKTWQCTSRYFIVEVPGSKKIGIRPIPVALNGTTASVQVIVPKSINPGDTFTIGMVAIDKLKFTTRRRIANSVLQATLAASTGINACWKQHFQSFRYMTTKTIRAITWQNRAREAVKIEMFYSYPLQTLTFYQNDVPNGVIMGTTDISDRTLYAFLGVSKTQAEWFRPYPYITQARCPIVRIEGVGSPNLSSQQEAVEYKPLLVKSPGACKITI